MCVTAQLINAKKRSIYLIYLSVTFHLMIRTRFPGDLSFLCHSGEPANRCSVKVLTILKLPLKDPVLQTF